LLYNKALYTVTVIKRIKDVELLIVDINYGVFQTTCQFSQKDA